MAKQVIFQKVREAERDTVFNEYAHRAGEILTATVKRLEPMDVIFDLGKTEARMPKREQSRLEQFAIGERVRVVLLRVDRAAKGPQVIVSRAAPALVQSLFQSEVPEIYDGTVSIRAIAREAGERTKIAVQSRDKDVDPVGACVGMKGMRVQSIIRELRGEKIDIIEFSEEITTFAEKALQPAKVARVSITDLAEKQLEVIVDDTQLSLAIGKKGQNVRLAAKLLQWKIDIKSEEEKRQEVEQQMQAMGGGPSTPIEQVTELGESVMEKLIAAGITTVESLADMTAEELGEIPGIGEKTVEKIAVAVRHYFGQYEEGDTPRARASARRAHTCRRRRSPRRKCGDRQGRRRDPLHDRDAGGDHRCRGARKRLRRRGAPSPTEDIADAEEADLRERRQRCQRRSRRSHRAGQRHRRRFSSIRPRRSPMKGSTRPMMNAAKPRIEKPADGSETTEPSRDNSLEPNSTFD
jgi:N utilization substance protein A